MSFLEMMEPRKAIVEAWKSHFSALKKSWWSRWCCRTLTSTLLLLGSLVFYSARGHEVTTLGAVDAPPLPQAALSLFGSDSGSAHLHGLLHKEEWDAVACPFWWNEGTDLALSLSHSKRRLSILMARTALRGGRSEGSSRGAGTFATKDKDEPVRGVGSTLTKYTQVSN